MTVTLDTETACGGAERFAEMIRVLEELTDALGGSEAVADLFRALHTSDLYFKDHCFNTFILKICIFDNQNKWFLADLSGISARKASLLHTHPIHGNPFSSITGMQLNIPKKIIKLFSELN